MIILDASVVVELLLNGPWRTLSGPIWLGATNRSSFHICWM
jgi:hypothetical protein